MKFAPIIFHRSFRSHCPTVGPNLTLAIKNSLRSSDQSLTWQTTADYLRLLFSPDASSPTARFFIRFFIRSSDQSGNGTPALTIFRSASKPHQLKFSLNVSASYLLAPGFASRSFHTKYHHKNGTNCTLLVTQA